MVVFIVLITMIAGVLKARYSYQKRELATKDDPEALRMREEIKMLRDGWQCWSGSRLKRKIRWNARSSN
jgi:hypothetical protein